MQSTPAAAQVCPVVSLQAETPVPVTVGGLDPRAILAAASFSVVLTVVPSSVRPESAIVVEEAAFGIVFVVSPEMAPAAHTADDPLTNTQLVPVPVTAAALPDPSPFRALVVLGIVGTALAVHPAPASDKLAHVGRACVTAPESAIPVTKLLLVAAEV